jgi:hypothetical protein
MNDVRYVMLRRARRSHYCVAAIPVSVFDPLLSINDDEMFALLYAYIVQPLLGCRSLSTT